MSNILYEICDIIFVQTYTCSYRDLFDHKYLARFVDIQYMARSQMRDPFAVQHQNCFLWAAHKPSGKKNILTSLKGGSKYSSVSADP